MRYSKSEREEALARLHAILDPFIVEKEPNVGHPLASERTKAKGPVICTRLDHVSRSGMSRLITPMLFAPTRPVVDVAKEMRRLADKNKNVTVRPYTFAMWADALESKGDECAPNAYYLGHDMAVILGWSHKDQAVKVEGCGMDMGFHLIYSAAMTLYREKYGTDAGYILAHRWL